MKRAIGNDQDYLEFPRKALLDKIGMRNTLISTDRFGDFILSSQVYTNARDLARLGLLYLQAGCGTASASSRSPGSRSSGRRRRRRRRAATSTAATSGSSPTTARTCRRTPTATNGNRGQFTVIVPSHNLVIVRRGLDYGRQGFNQWDLTREVLKAIK